MKEPSPHSASSSFTLSALSAGSKEPSSVDLAAAAAAAAASDGDGLKANTAGNNPMVSSSGPTKLSQLRYSGYSAEFLDRVEPNGNIPHKQIQGKSKYCSYASHRGGGDEWGA